MKLTFYMQLVIFAIIDLYVSDDITTIPGRWVSSPGYRGDT